jgi:2,4-dienoyl-CoA reductase-like NADH-dependent reductase (Old Yellow Enzyme family)
LAWLANPDLVKDIIQRRIDERSDDYITYCAMCRDLFAGRGKRIIHILDLIYGEDIERLINQKGPSYSQRHENRARLKRQLLKQFQGGKEEYLEKHEKIKLKISPEVSECLENRLILVEDIQKVIEAAEDKGEKFLDQDTGHILAYFRPNNVTYWVEYSIEEEEFLIHKAYSHRMEIEGN